MFLFNTNLYKYFEITGIKRQVLISTCMFFGHMMLGFTISWPGAVLQKLNDPEQTPLTEKLTETQLSLIATLLYVGCIPDLGNASLCDFIVEYISCRCVGYDAKRFIRLCYCMCVILVWFSCGGPYLVGWLANIKGRKPCFVLGGVSCLIAYLILATAKTLAMIYIGRILSGGVAIVVVMNLVYLGEIASTNIRGILLTILGLSATFGGIITFSAGHFLSYTGVCYVGIALCLIFTITTLLIPESPIFYILKGKDDDVIKVLNDLGRSDDINKLLAVKKEFQEKNAKKDWTDLFTLRRNRKALTIVVSLNIFQHCSGSISVIIFAGSIFAMAGSSVESNISMLIISAFQLVGSSVGPILIERSGRKMLLAVSCAICSASMFLLGTYFYLYQLGSPIVENIKWFPLVILIIFFIGYDFGLGIIPGTLTGEMFTVNVRSNGSSLTITIAYIVGFLLSTAFGSLIQIVGGHVTFWFFGVICICAVLFTVFCVVETKGKSLLEIQEILDRK